MLSLKPTAIENELQIVFGALEAPDEIDRDVPADRVDVVVVDPLAAVLVHEAHEGRQLFLAPIAVIIE